jgi:hypothetical protein
MTSIRLKSRQQLAILAVSSLVATIFPMHPASANRSCNYLAFRKDTNKNSVLLAYWTFDGNCAGSASWRAGSGVSTDGCEENKGWLPNGWYDSPFMDHSYNGVYIRGRVWRLSDKQCQAGAWRTELFIHSEETPTNTQLCTSNTDDPWCWDGTPNGDATNDYASEGCVKVRRNSPEHNKSADLGPLHDRWHNSLGLTHSSRSDALYVYR